LLMNGVEAMAENAPENRRLVIQVLAGGDGFAQVRVADVGVGLDAGVADRVFDAFFSTKPGGIGMGLSICRSIVEAHGGRIWAANHEPRGSLFCFTVPLASAGGAR
jgi:signal transduction histidine kinase